MIFCAGLGTRFKPWTDLHPKALALVNGKSLLQRNIEYLQQYGIMDVIVNVHHFPEQVRSALRQHKGWGSNIIVSDETKEVLETGGGLVKARPYFTEGEDFLAINVDILTDLNLNEFIRFHQSKMGLVSLAVSGRKSSRCFVFDNDNRLIGWKNLQTGQERMTVNSYPSFPKAFSGISLYRYEFFEALAMKGKFSLVDAFLSLATDHAIYGYEHSGEKWVDVGRPESVAVAESLFY